jgi:uncharacterized iron-regulated membrane protein
MRYEPVFVQKQLHLAPATAKQKSPRLLVVLHRWAGLVLALFVVILGLTGATLVFRPEIDRALNTDLFRVDYKTRELATGKIMDSIARRYPDARVHEVMYAEVPGESWRVLIRPSPGNASGRALEVFVNPTTGAIIGERVHVDALLTPAPLDRRSVMAFIRRFHYEWLLGETAYRVMGVIAFVWLATTLVGLYIAWPQRSQWRRALSIKWSAGALRGWFDAHRSIGLASSLILLPVMITGLWWNMDVLVRPLVGAILPQSGSIHVMREHHEATDVDAPRVSVDDIVRQAMHREPGARLTRVVLDYSMGQYIVWLQHPGGSGLVWLAHDMNGGGNAMLTYSMFDGELVQAVNADTARAGDVYAGLQYPLHTGSYFGLVGRCLWLIAGLMPVVLAASGVYVWAKRRSGRKSPRSRALNSAVR